MASAGLKSQPGSGYSGRYLKHRTVGLSCPLKFRPTDTPLSPEPWGDQGALSTHNVAQDCYFVVLAFSCICSQTLFPIAGIASVTFRSVHLLFYYLPPRHVGGPREVFDMVFLVLSPVFPFDPPFFACPPPPR